VTAFGERIEVIRKDKGVSLRALGAAINMSHGNVQKILKGRHGASEEIGHKRLRPPKPPLGADLEAWFDVLGTNEADEPLLRLLAAAAHVPADADREVLEAFIIAHQVVVPEPLVIRRATIPRHVAEAETPAPPSTRETPVR
jgi:transcriptional regulator with XRE-family HTH domain